jgi:hypothetical protein
LVRAQCCLEKRLVIGNFTLGRLKKTGELGNLFRISSPKLMRFLYVPTIVDGGDDRDQPIGLPPILGANTCLCGKKLRSAHPDHVLIRHCATNLGGALPRSKDQTGHHAKAKGANLGHW